MYKEDMICGIVVFVLLLIFIVPVIYSVSIGYSNQEIIEITVKEKYIKNYNKSSKYIIVDDKREAYQITDLLFKGKFNSTDIYNSLDIGKTYKIETTGKRIPFLSMYKNINKILEEFDG